VHRTPILAVDAKKIGVRCTPYVRMEEAEGLMSNLILDSLEIRNFRAFRELRIERLGRVNLIVGKNNVGKTSILEALRLYAQPGSPSILLELLEARNEIDLTSNSNVLPLYALPVPVERLFYGRRSILQDSENIQIGPCPFGPSPPRGPTLWIELEEFDGPPGTERLPREQLARHGNNPGFSRRVLNLAFRRGDNSLYIPVNNLLQTITFRDENITQIRSFINSDSKSGMSLVVVNPNGLTALQISRLWDNVSLTRLEEETIAAVRIISEEVERLSLKSVAENSQIPVPFVKVKGFDHPIPMRSLGDGVNRLFGIALALVNAKDGILLVDEIENGIHYTVLPDVWRLIFQTAQRLNVQVFATSHSWDCIEAFQKAAKENTEAEGVLVRLYRRGDEIRAVNLDERELEIAVDGKIEVR
jgi:hypothetical protein